MELLTAALVVILLTTASSSPIGQYHHYDADITDKDRLQGWLEGTDWLSWQSTGSSTYENSSPGLFQTRDSSSESSESSESSQSQSSEESSEDTTPAMTTDAMTTAMTEEGSTLTPEPGTILCVTDELPTAEPATVRRGDN